MVGESGRNPGHCIKSDPQKRTPWRLGQESLRLTYQKLEDKAHWDMSTSILPYLYSGNENTNDMQSAIILHRRRRLDRIERADPRKRG